MAHDKAREDNLPRAEWISRDAVFAALEMNQVLEHYRIQPGRGSSYRICCPFHEDERPSCSINPRAKVFNCFACGEQGNVLDFIAGMEGLDPAKEFRAVLETAIELIGYNPTPERGNRKSSKVSRASGKDSQRDEAEVENAETQSAADEPEATETEVQAKAKPAHKRGKAVEATKPDDSLELEANRVLEGPAFPLKLERAHPWLMERLEAIGLTAEDAERLGIGFEPRSNALMAGRVCFPIHNAEGELVAYAGRWASDEVNADGRFVDGKGKEQERYKLPGGFRKQLELYNLHSVVRQFPEDKNNGLRPLVLVEGFWSALRLSSLTIPVVALMGLSISEAQIRLLKEHGFDHLILMLDGDEEGKSATQVMLAKLAPHFFVTDANLADGVKPDTMDEASLIALRESLPKPSKANAKRKQATQRKQPAKLKTKPQAKPKPTKKKESKPEAFGTIGHSFTISPNANGNGANWP